MELPEDVLQQFRDHGRAGGHARARNLAAADRARIARLAAMARWTRRRFGASHFADLGLPGADLVDKGLADAVSGVESVASLLVTIAATRLRREGVPVPPVSWPDPELRCYRLMEEDHGELAHARYHALLEQMESFADACHLVRRESRPHAQ